MVFKCSGPKKNLSDFSPDSKNIASLKSAAEHLVRGRSNSAKQIRSTTCGFSLQPF